MRKREKKRNKTIYKIITIIVLVVLAVFVISIAPDYIRDDIKDKTNLVINNKNVTANLKNDIYIDDNDVIYLSEKDIENYFDKYLYYDEQYNQMITTYEKKVATISLSENKKSVNGTEDAINGKVIEKDEVKYLPFSELKDVYNMDLTYVKEKNTVIVDSLEKDLIKVDAAQDLSIKYKPKALSRTVAKVNKGEKLVFAGDAKDGWAKVRTLDGTVGFVKAKDLANKTYIRNELVEEKQITGKVNLVWDYFSRYGKAPNRNGTSIDGVNVVSPAFFSLIKDGDGSIRNNIGLQGEEYINWAKSKGYKVWAMVSNTEETGMMDTTSKIMNDYQLRTKLINNIISNVVKYNLDGVNIDFENMKEEDKDMYSRFIIELEPRLKEIGKVLTVDVTAPDGAPTWSLCFDRNVIGDVADYIVFMAYDQYGSSTNKIGTTAGFNWVQTNLKKFTETEVIPSEKIILGVPLYTRLWKETQEGKITSTVVNMKDIDAKLGENIKNKVWKDELKQNYVEYTNGTDIYRMWIEDIDSLKAKLSLIKEKNLGGVASWSKDREPEEVWPTIKEALQ
ncbi:MAG: glycosyl hydrolase family 18 protein [Clostridia bacterium]